MQLPFPADAEAELRWLTGDLNKIHPLRLGLTDYLTPAFACAGVYK